MLTETPGRVAPPLFDADFKRQIDAIRAEYGSISNFLQKNKLRHISRRVQLWGTRMPVQTVKLGKPLSITTKS
jgi:hypothetical protein